MAEYPFGVYNKWHKENELYSMNKFADKVHAKWLSSVLPSPVYATYSDSYHCMMQTDTSEEKVNPGAINVFCQ